MLKNFKVKPSVCVLLLLPFWVCPVWGCLLRWSGRRWWGWAAPGSRTLLWFLQSSLRQCDSYPEPAPGPEGGSGRVSNECFYTDIICYTQSNGLLIGLYQMYGCDLFIDCLHEPQICFSSTFISWFDYRVVVWLILIVTLPPRALLINVKDNLNITNDNRWKPQAAVQKPPYFPFKHSLEHNRTRFVLVGSKLTIVFVD